MMVYFSELATAFMTALVLENLLFTRAIDIPSLYEKRTPGQIILIGSVLTGIIAVCSIPSYFLNRFLGSQSSLSRFLTLGLLILNILVFLAAYFLIRRFAPALFARIGDALPFYGVNCVTLGTLMIASRISDSSKFFSFFGYCVGAGVSFTAALLLLWSVRQRLALHGARHLGCLHGVALHEFEPCRGVVKELPHHNGGALGAASGASLHHLSRL